MFKDDVMEVLDIFQEYHVSAETQREVLLNGLYFNYTWGDPDPYGQNKFLNFFQVGTLLRYLKHNNMEFDVEKLFHLPYDFEYPEIVAMIADGRIPTKQKTFNKREGR